jgi:hypothetical protein
MELGEDANPAVIADVDHDPDCYFCKPEEPAENTNDLTAEPEEDEDLDGPEEPEESFKFKNDASKLGKNLGGDPGRKDVVVYDKPRPVSAAAHHLIPGNAAFAKSQLFKSKKYLWMDGNAKGNIGYNINGQPNGVWLPGNYAVRPWSSLNPVFQNRYAFKAIEAWGRQFHDAHEAYSRFVLQALEEIFEKLDAGGTLWCPKAKKEEDKEPSERPPMYALVMRLNTVSQRMKRMLVVPTTSWKANVYTSTRSLTFMNETAEHLLAAAQ